MATIAPKLVETTQLLSRFRGCLVGAVVGDCLGQHYEGSWTINVPNLVRFFGKIKEDHSPKPSGETKKKSYVHWHEFTDDTAMARSVANSLIENNGLNVRDMAQRFVSEYYKEPDRGYGGNVITVFVKLREMDCLNPHGPATEQFDGRGSYGNGAAMRIAPAALHGAKLPTSELNSLVEKISKITHTHRNAINGAIMECAAVRLALQQESSKPLDVMAFIDSLHADMQQVEMEGKPAPATDKDGKSAESSNGAPSDEVKPDTPFCDKLVKMKTYLEQGSVSRELIAEELGNNISALGSVPAAVYSFLRCTEPVHDIKVDSAFERTIMYAISLGGDTDTIATMAGAIAGAYYGIESVPREWQVACEGVETATEQAQSLYKLVMASSDKS